MLLSTHTKTIYEPFPGEIESKNPFNSSYESNNTHISPPPYFECIQNDIPKKTPYNNIFLGLSIITLIIIYSSVYDNDYNFDYNFDYDNEWNEPSSIQPSGGKKIEKSLFMAYRCVNRQGEGTNLRGWERYRQARNECKELIYYMKYGFMLEWLLNVILYSSIITITIVIIYCINKFQV